MNHTLAYLSKWGWENKACTLRQSNMAMENGPFEDVFPIKHGDIPLLC